jgi:hypothetical protein
MITLMSTIIYQTIIFFFLFVFITSNVKVTKFITSLGVGDDTQKVTKLVFLEELFGEVLDVSLGKRGCGSNSDGNAGSSSSNGDSVREVSSAAFNLDSIMQKLFKSSQIKDAIGNGLGSVKSEFGGSSFLGNFLEEGGLANDRESPTLLYQRQQ